MYSNVKETLKKSENEYIIKPCAVGYGIYDKPYWFNGRRCQGLWFTARTKQECIDIIERDGATYIEEDKI